MSRVKQIPTGASGITAAAGWEVTTYGTPAMYRSVFRAKSSAALSAIAGGAALGVGDLVGSFPAGELIVHASGMDIALQQTEGNVTADTPDLGFGTTVASGAVSVLSGTAAFENLLTGQTMNDCDGTFETKTVGTQLVIATADSHDIYLNAADTWAASGDAALGIVGVYEVLWTPIGGN